MWFHVCVSQMDWSGIDQNTTCPSSSDLSDFRFGENLVFFSVFFTVNETDVAQSCFPGATRARKNSQQQQGARSAPMESPRMSARNATVMMVPNGAKDNGHQSAAQTSEPDASEAHQWYFTPRIKDAGPRQIATVSHSFCMHIAMRTAVDP